MKSNRLIVFGDSWAAGIGATNPANEGFVPLLGKKLNCTVLNYGQQATSISHATWQLISFLKSYKPGKHNDKILFCLTGKIRSWYFKNNQSRELHPTRSDMPSKMYYSYVYSDELGNAERIKNIILIDSLCSRYSLPVYFVLNWDEPPDHPLIDLNKFYPTSLLSLFELDTLPEEKFTSEYINNRYMNQFHPNNLGHQVIAEALFNWIQ